MSATTPAHTSYKRFDKEGKCIRKGNKAEEKFEKMAKQRSLLVADVGMYDNCRRHIDKMLTCYGREIPVSIKAMKKAHRSHPKVSSHLFLIEIHGKKTKGWLYDSKAKILAQEVPDGFILLRREDIIRYVETVVLPSYETLEPQKSTKNNCPGHIYSRIYQDQFIFVEIEHMLEHIDHTRWVDKKPKGKKKK
jgi:hypothetical protein